MNKEIAPVLAEIAAVLKKHDMTGLVIVGSQTHVDFRMEIEASWSCAKFETDLTGRPCVRIRCQRADFESLEAQKKCLEATTGMFVTFSDTMDRLNQNIHGIMRMIAEHVPFLGRSNTEE